MSMVLTIWTTAILACFAGYAVTVGNKMWDYGNPAICVGIGVTVVLTWVPTIYELGWVALPMAMGR